MHRTCRGIKDNQQMEDLSRLCTEKKTYSGHHCSVIVIESCTNAIGHLLENMDREYYMRTPTPRPQSLVPCPGRLSRCRSTTIFEIQSIHMINSSNTTTTYRSIVVISPIILICPSKVSIVTFFEKFNVGFPRLSSPMDQSIQCPSGSYASPL